MEKPAGRCRASLGSNEQTLQSFACETLQSVGPPLPAGSRKKGLEMKLTDEQITAALDRAVDANLHIEDKSERATAIRRQAVVEGASLVTAELEQLRALADELISFQAEYAEKAFEPGGMPGNEYYRPKLVKIVNQARAARGQ